MKLKKVMALALSTCMIASAVVGCGAKDEATDTQGQAGTESEDAGNGEETPKSDITLTVMAAQDQIRDVEQNIIAPMFEEETGIKIDFQITPSDQYDNLLVTKLDTDAAADIFLAQSGALSLESRYNPEKNCVDLSDMDWVSRYKEVVKESSSLNDKVYCQTIWNVESSVWTVAYNKTLFEENGIMEAPTTYEEFKAACDTLVAAGIIPMYESVVDSWHPTCSLMEALVKAEANTPGTFQKLNKNEIKFTDIPEAVELVTQFQEVGQKYSGESYMSNEFVNAAASLASGEYAMVVNRPTVISEIADGYADQPYGNEDDYAVFVMPYLDNQLVPVNPQGPSRFIFSGSENVEAAKQYLEFCAREDVIQLFIDNEATFSMLPYEGTQSALKPYEQTFFDANTAQGTVTQAAVSYVDPQWMDISKDIQMLYMDQITPEELLENIDTRRATQAEQMNDEYWQ